MGPSEFSSILLCQKYAGTVVKKTRDSPPATSRAGGKSDENRSHRASSNIEFGNLLHESIQFTLTGPQTVEENLATITEILEEVADGEMWTEGIISTLPKSSKNNEQGDDFDEDDALDLIDEVEKFLDFIETRGWLHAKWEKEVPVSGIIETRWGNLRLDGFVDLKGEYEGGAVIIEIKSSRKYSDSWKIQVGLYSEMALAGTYSEVAFWSPMHEDSFTQEEAITSLRLRTKPEIEGTRPVHYLCRKCEIYDCPVRTI